MSHVFCFFRKLQGKSVQKVAIGKIKEAKNIATQRER